MLRSIRWTLQFWHAAMLIVAVAGIGTASYFEIRQARYREVDSEMEAAAQLVVGKLRLPRPQDLPPPRFMEGPGDNFEGGRLGAGQGGSDDLAAGDPRHRDDAGPPEDQMPRHRRNRDDRPPDRLPRNLDMPPGFLDRYRGTPEDSRSFIIFRGTHEVLASFGQPLEPVNFPKHEFFAGNEPFLHIRNGDLHQLLLAAPAHAKVLVSWSVAPINDQLRKLIWMLAGTATGIVLLGLTGGWFFSLGAVKPIRRMTAAAEAISATHLSERIDPKAVPSELTDLARVLNAAFARLEVAFAQQARFTADASHELRTPLTVVLSHTQLALSRDRTVEEYQKTLITCMAASKRMKSLVDSLLLLSHADVGELALDKQELDLGAIVSDSVMMLSPLAAERGIVIQTELTSASLSGDPVRLGQLVTNLLSNAIRYNRDGGHVVASTTTTNDSVELRVTDTGVGISAENQVHVFDRFFRADKARSREAGGSGLGLAICKSIVEAHGGTISLTSEPGTGSTFTVTFPTQAAGVASAAPLPPI